MKFQALDDLLQANLWTVYTAAVADVRVQGVPVYQTALGTLDPEGQSDHGAPHTTLDTYFDFASLTKLFATTAFFRLVDAGQVALDDAVGSVLSNFSGARSIRPYPDPLVPGRFIEVHPPTEHTENADRVTFRHLLTHSSGLPAWLNLHEADDELSRLAMCIGTAFAYPTGTRTLYSDVGYILLGAAVERLTKLPLDEAMHKLMQHPLGLSIHYGPLADQVAPTEICPWRQQRLVGDVDDENAATLHGVSGHAGLFGTARDLTTLGQLYLAGGAGFISPELVQESTRRQVENRGLCWLINPPQASPAGRLFSARSFGHTGFTGTSLWIDPERQLVCTLLTNRVFFGRNPEAITRFRPQFHDTVINCLRDR